MIKKMCLWALALSICVVSSLGYLEPGTAALLWAITAASALFNFAVNFLVDRVYTEQRSLHGGRDVLIGVSKVVVGRFR